MYFKSENHSSIALLENKKLNSTQIRELTNHETNTIIEAPERQKEEKNNLPTNTNQETKKDNKDTKNFTPTQQIPPKK